MYFDGLNDYGSYARKHDLLRKLGIEFSDEVDLSIKNSSDIFVTVDCNNKEPLPAEMDDLIRLHYLMTSRRVTTVLEFGVGKSTKIFDDALRLNQRLFGDSVVNEQRRSTPFQCHSVDTSAAWIKTFKEKYETENVVFYETTCHMTEFSGRICTRYEVLPNVCPDLIYIDAPDQYNVAGEVNGISTRAIDRMPMAADLLAIEHFLLPGTLVVLDGRTANARMLKANLQRQWSYTFVPGYDQHFFELVERPLGDINRRQIQMMLGADWSGLDGV